MAGNPRNKFRPKSRRFQIRNSQRNKSMWEVPGLLPGIRIAISRTSASASLRIFLIQENCGCEGKWRSAMLTSCSNNMSPLSARCRPESRRPIFGFPTSPRLWGF